MDESRRARGRLGALALHASHDSRVTSKPGRDAFLARFEREVDPEGKLPSAERARRAAYARRLYMGRLALRSAKVRKERSRAPAGERGSRSSTEATVDDASSS
jgi:hypothetical protein